MALGDVGTQTRFSAILRLLAASPRERIGVDELLDRFGDRSFGAAMLLLALPNMVPLPPGASTVFGLPLILIATQLALGRRTIWLPELVRRQTIPTTLFSKIVGATRPHLRRAERALRPRLQLILAPVGMRLLGLACVILAILIALPIPLANFLSGLAVSIFSLGLLRHDGLAVLIGWIAAAVSVGATVLVSGAVWIAAREMFEWITRML